MEKQKQRRERIADDAKMYVSEAQIKRYQYRGRWHLREFTTLSLSPLYFRLWRIQLGPLQIFGALFFRYNCFATLPNANQWNVAEKRHQHNRIVWNLIFNIFFSPTFSLMFKMKVNICLELSSAVSRTLQSSLLIFHRMHSMWAWKKLSLLLSPINDCQAKWMRQMDCQFHVRKRFVHGICFGKYHKCEMPLELLIDSRRRQKGSLEVGSKCLAINREASKKQILSFLCNFKFYCLQHEPSAAFADFETLQYLEKTSHKRFGVLRANRFSGIK